MYPDSLKNLIESFKYLPGIGEKTAERLAFAVLEFDEDQCELFSQSLLDVKSKIKKCSICNTLTENDVCFVCSNSLRDNDKLGKIAEDTKTTIRANHTGEVVDIKIYTTVPIEELDPSLAKIVSDYQKKRQIKGKSNERTDQIPHRTAQSRSRRVNRSKGIPCRA